ncbi:MAG: selenocysteine-specific translation elongation factor [Clostridiales bacterium]|jgi:selenocysteine-specific elongation factor|nr:selenocysteine-specific translation elongation factor [Clostridiales bacterium]
MNNVIIGTAGHVDHGKTSLIKALTGIDTDRLTEEKKRGITIELGFAHIDFIDGRKAGIVDVPGHEKFIKNMLAGAGGIDIALIVVAANEGVMPQTIEHFEILKLLGIKKGVIAITKTDMMSSDWVDMIKGDVMTLVKGTPFENSPIIETSVYNNTGIDELRNLLNAYVIAAEEKDLTRNFRIPVDRVFSIDGFGTVITGTLIEGHLSKGDSAVIYPGGQTTKIRNVQVHDNDVETAYAGQRVAVNLASIKREEAPKGRVIAAPDSMFPTFMVDVKLNILNDCNRTVKNNSRVHIFHGSAETLCKVVLLDRDELNPGESGYAQLRLEDEMVFKYGDRYIIRFYSPMETIGGGMVVNPLPKKHPRFKDEILNTLDNLENGSPDARLLEIIKERSAYFDDLEKLRAIANMSDPEFKDAFDALKNKNLLTLPGKNTVISAQYYKQISAKATTALNDFHSKNPFKNGMNIEEFKSKCLRAIPEILQNNIVATLTEGKVIKSENGLIAAFSFKVKMDDTNSKTASMIEKIYLDAGVLVPTRDDALKLLSDKNKGRIMDSLIDKGTLVMVDKQMLFHEKVFNDCLLKMRAFITQNGDITLAQFRDLIGASRKYAVAILEYCDAKKITKKIGDSRVLNG